jgi:uncharacterized protein
MAEVAHVFLMVKAPARGRVKTRLAREIGEGESLRFYRHNTRAVIARLRRDPRWRLVLAVSPQPARHARWWPRALPRVAQVGGDLGARMAHIFSRGGPGPTLVIGSDIPGITATCVASALRSLRGHDAVIGPAPDGGYWLLGLRRPPPPLGMLDGVRWSGPHAMPDTLANLQASGFRVALTDELSDVDDAASYRAEGGANMRLIPARSR